MLCAAAATEAAAQDGTIVLNQQLQLGDVFAGQTLNVVDSQDQVTVQTSAQGNSASGAVYNFVSDVEARTQRIDQHLTDIMLAQDFHDLTGQVVAKVVKLANDLEDSLVKLLVQVVPPEQREKVDPTVLAGPVVSAEGRTDVVSNQGEVDDLLASLGF